MSFFDASIQKPISYFHLGFFCRTDLGKPEGLFRTPQTNTSSRCNAVCMDLIQNISSKLSKLFCCISLVSPRSHRSNVKVMLSGTVTWDFHKTLSVQALHCYPPDSGALPMHWKPAGVQQRGALGFQNGRENIKSKHSRTVCALNQYGSL